MNALARSGDEGWSKDFVGTQIRLDRRDRMLLLWRGISATYGKRSAQFRRNAAAFAQKKHAGRLTPEQVADLARGQTKKVDRDNERRTTLAITDAIISGPPARISMQQRGAIFLAATLDMHADLRIVANIGARVDITSSYLARRFPDRSFVSVDLQPKLREHNAGLAQSPNWTFASGYALDLIERREIKPDAVFMTSTSVLFNSVELDEYISAMRAAGVRAIILNEPWWPAAAMPLPRLLLPEQIDPDDPVCAGQHGNFHHNYPAKLARAGYATRASTITAGNVAAGYTALQLVATAEI